MLVDLLGLAGQPLQRLVELAVTLCRVESMRMLAVSSALAAWAMVWPWLVTPDTWRTRFSDTPLQEVGLAGQPFDGVERLARDAVAGAAHLVDAVHHGLVELAGMLAERVGQRRAHDAPWRA